MLEEVYGAIMALARMKWKSKHTCDRMEYLVD